MNIYAISDLHLSTAVEKPMDIFGDNWQNHFEKIAIDWQSKVTHDDLVLLGGDISWGINLDEAEPDFKAISDLPGEKFVVRGNHDYYWNSLSKMQSRFPDFNFIQNNCYRQKNVLIAGARGWTIASESSTDADKKIYARELQRLDLSLSSLQSKRHADDFTIVIMHYPPFEATFADTDFTRLLEKYRVDKVLYGHLHGKNARVKEIVNKNGIDYFLTSCDLLNHKLVKIAEVL